MRITTWLLCLASVYLVAAAKNNAQVLEDLVRTGQNFCDSITRQEDLKTEGLLYPRESETREVRSLDGIWRFAKTDGQGVREKWYSKKLDQSTSAIDMPVPASYNDITVDDTLRDFVGTVWYERHFFVPARWKENHKVWLRFGSVHYEAVVYINGEKAFSHKIGHLPFEGDISSLLKFGEENRLQVSCDNRLDITTIPQGEVVDLDGDNGSFQAQTYTFDFFNYAGIHRSVHLYTTPLNFIKDIGLQTSVSEGTGTIKVNIKTIGSGSVVVKLRDKDGKEVEAPTKSEAQTKSETQTISVVVPDVKPWWPYLMHPQPGYLYELEIKLVGAEQELLDVYRMPVGIRDLVYNADNLLINGQPVYLRGLGKHEDSDIRGKGLDLPLLTRDFNLLQWVGANAYRTSHYPYSEESMQFADEHGIMIIDECSSVNTQAFSATLLENHKSALEQLIHRDRNHASAIAWSIANEPRSAKKSAEPYFQLLTEYVKAISQGRPITAAINVVKDQCVLAQYLDIIGFNRYNAWYANPGHLNMIENFVQKEASGWRSAYQKPVIMFEYGADTMEGYHTLPSYIWSEEYQKNLLSNHFRAFDKLRSGDGFIGEFVWNFADFKTEQVSTRVGGNKKGIFTRDRQPKAAAFLLRQRYHGLAQKLYNATLPADYNVYIID